ncbi:MAG: Purine-binding protein precursor [Firmicutes bacterium ADurb.Bin193]|nr:MAG: Purine-binding protein precursor [Firmicutes bacterium ADurb.Bin193]
MKKVSKILVLMLAVALAVSATACTVVQRGGNNPEQYSAKSDIKVGFIYIGSTSDKGYTYAHDQGAIYMQKELGLSDDQVIKKENVPEDGACEAAIKELIEAGCKIIFGTSFGYMNYMDELSKEYPDVIFSHCSGFKSNDTNFNNYFGRIYQARYLSGIAAGLKTKTNKIGYVGAYKIPEVVGGCDAFALGVQSVNPKAQVLFVETQTWYNPDLERKAAISLLDKGCDVIAQHQDTAMPQKAAEERGVWGVGYNADMTEEAPKAHLTAPIWNWGVYYKEAVQKVIDGTWKSENYFDGMKEGLVDISPLSANVAEGTQQKIDEARAKIISGEFDVFDGPIKDNTGKERVAKGSRLTDGEITSIDWFVENVKVQ